jgi:hypothetical protein
MIWSWGVFSGFLGLCKSFLSSCSAEVFFVFALAVEREESTLLFLLTAPEVSTVVICLAEVFGF